MQGRGTHCLVCLVAQLLPVAAYRMTVVEGWFAGTKYSKPPTMADLPEKAQDVISNNISVNSSVRPARLITA